MAKKKVTKKVVREKAVKKRAVMKDGFKDANKITQEIADADAAFREEQPIVKSAPNPLIVVYSRQPKILGHVILGRLLRDTQMQRAWTYLAPHVNSAGEWEQLWNEIAWILRNTRKDPILRTEERVPYLKIAKQAVSLAQSIKEGPLDLRAYELFPDEVMKISGVSNWETLDKFERSVSARKLLKTWPYVPELLTKLAKRAQQLADDMMTKDRVVERKTRDYEKLYFVRTLNAYFMCTYQTKLYGTVARIATAVLEIDIDYKFVEKAITKRTQ